MFRYLLGLKRKVLRYGVENLAYTLATVISPSGERRKLTTYISQLKTVTRHREEIRKAIANLQSTWCAWDDANYRWLHVRDTRQ